MDVAAEEKEVFVQSQGGDRGESCYKGGVEGSEKGEEEGGWKGEKEG